MIPGTGSPSSSSVGALGQALQVRVEPADPAEPLDGCTVAGEIYIALEPVTNVDRVTFYLDDPNRVRKAHRIENNPPFDFDGGTSTTPNPWDSTDVEDGSHVITAVVRFLNGTTEVLHSTFTVSNTAPPDPGGGGGDGGGGDAEGTVGSRGHTIRSQSDLDDSPASLHGLSLGGENFVSLGPTSEVDQVSFWLDDPDRSGPPYRVENNPPFDFAGGSATVPNPWDTGDHPDGAHEITALLVYLDGETEVIRAVFTIDNEVPAIVSSPSSVSFSFGAGTAGTGTATSDLSLSDGGSGAFSLQVPFHSWLTVTQSSGQLPATITISVNSSGLAPGEHGATIVASAAGFASAQIAVTLSVAAVVEPPSGNLTFGESLVTHAYIAGSPGGNSTPVTLSATDASIGAFTLSHSPASWLSVSPTAGTLPAQIQVQTSSIGLAAGIYESEIVAAAVGSPPATLTVRMTIAGAPSGSETVASSVSRHGITWNFDGEYEVGQFANGDWYVVGPVIIDSTSPSWTGTYDGAMINPVYDGDHGYDSRWDFDPALRVDTNGLLLLPGQSLICVDSWRNGESGAPSSNNTLGIPRPALKTAAVLTCLSFAPPPGTFRPPYGGSEKPLFHVSQLRTWLLPQLPKPANTPSMAETEASFARVWLDHTEKWTNRYTHPSDNMHDYGRDLASEYNTGSLMLMCDFTLAQKETLLIRLVQIGIDMHAIIESGAEWGPDTGGHGSGRKWPVLLAGILLNDNEMMSVGANYGTSTAMEDCQTFYLTSSQLSDYPGHQVGDPVWGERHCSNPSSDPGATGYRTCCTANAWVGAVLSVHILTGETDIDVKALWNHDALFDYQDLYMDEQDPGSWERSWSLFQEQMWDMYRSDYGPVYNP